MTETGTAEIAEFLRRRLDRRPAAILVLGSGLGGVAEEIEGGVRIPYSEVPGFPRSTVEGHAGALVAGRWAGVDVVAMAGRFHLYEGWSEAEVARPIRALAALGPRVMVVTNAAGGLRQGMAPGDLMLITDHLNLTGRNPLVGGVQEGEQRFPDMSDPYDAEFRRIAEETALAQRIPLEQGVYAAVLGPSYETPAEIRMLSRLGADAVGMSTAPETIVARARGVRVLGISCITNLAAGLAGHPLSHAEVMEVGAQARDRLARLVAAVLPRLVESAPPDPEVAR
jgi:purine-nucleoside phosphorylase